MRVSDEQVEAALDPLGFPPPVRRDVAAEGLVFYIAGEVQPVIVRGREEVTLGRHVTEGPPPASLVDLGTYHGHLLGVSRQHARVTLRGDECVLEDLNSTNGTWLNEKRLTSGTAYILSNGDQVRLGQLILFVYFSMTSSRQRVKLRLAGSAAAVVHRPPIMGLHLAGEMVPYLEALVALQKAIDVIQGRAPDERCDIPLLEVDGEQGSVDLTLVGLADAVSVVQQVIMPWQKEHVWLLAALWKGAAPQAALATEASLEMLLKKPDTTPLGGLGEAVDSAGEAPTVLDAPLLAGVTTELSMPESPDRDDGADHPAGLATAAEAAAHEALPAQAEDAAPERPDIVVDAPGVEPTGAETVPEADSAITLDALCLALQKQVLAHITTGFRAASSHDEAHLVLLKKPVEVLSRSPLEVSTSSY